VKYSANSYSRAQYSVRNNQQSRNVGKFAKSNVANDQISLDIVFAVFVLIVLQPVFWQMISIVVPQASFIVGSVGIELLVSAILALGFVGVAVKWEAALYISQRNLLVYFLVAICFTSVFWSLNPAFTLKETLNFLLVIVFGLALALRFGEGRLSFIFAISSFIMLCGQMLLSITNLENAISLAPNSNELALCIISSSWAFIANKNLRVLFAPILLFSLVVSLLTLNILAIVAIVSILAGAIIIYLNRAAIGVVISLAGSISILLFAFTALIMFFGENSANYLNDRFSDFSKSQLLGIGFGVSQNTLIGNFIEGMGIIGLVLGLLLIFFALIIAIMTAKKRPASAVALFGISAQILVDGAHITLIAPIMIYFFAALSQGLAPQNYIARKIR
jgi:hypothetical protein